MLEQNFSMSRLNNLVNSKLTGKLCNKSKNTNIGDQLSDSMWNVLKKSIFLPSFSPSILVYPPKLEAYQCNEQQLHEVLLNIILWELLIQLCRSLSSDLKKIPHTGDTEALDRCGWTHRYKKKHPRIFSLQGIWLGGGAAGHSTAKFTTLH